MNFDLNLPGEDDELDLNVPLPWEDDLDNISLEDVHNNVEDQQDGDDQEDVVNNVEVQLDEDDQEEVVSFDNFSLDDFLYDDGVDGEPINIGDDYNHDDDVNDEGDVNDNDDTVVENEVDELHEPPVVEGRYVQKVAKFLKSGYTDNVELDPPTQGMHFANGDELGAYCYQYAYNQGFQFYIRTSKLLECYSEKGVKRYGVGKSEPRFYMYKRVRLCCTRAAKPRKKNIDVSSFKPCECVVEATLLDDFMVIKKVILDHNHDDLNPKNSRHMVGYRVWDAYFKRRAMMNDEAGIPIAKNFNTLVREVGGHANLTVIERDLRNMLNQERRRFRIQGDANALEERFIKLKEIDPDFYYAIQTDSKGMLVNVFWADGRCRAMAKVFGDAISYDATFLCNRYKMPFTPFVGVNHHGSTVVLASALISHEDAVSFTWVFRRWLDCMGRPPSIIITDQCRGIGLDVKTVFPNVPHRLCLWHIMRNGFKNLGNFARFREIKPDLRDVVYESKDIDDFEASWQIFVDKYGIRGNSWIKEMYEKRDSWVPLYWRHMFCAVCHPHKEVSGMNVFFKNYVNPQTTLFAFLGNYENALRVKVEEEERLNFACTNKPSSYDKSLIVEEVFQRAYTNKMFAKVKKEVYALIHINASSEMNIGQFSSFVVTEEVKHPFWAPRDKNYNVTINTGTGEYNCSCQRFEFRGILCRHIIRAMFFEESAINSDKYILPRFRKDLVRGYEHLQVGYHTPGESERLKRSLGVTLRNDYIFRLALQSDDAFAIYDRDTSKMVKEMEATVGIQTLNDMGAGCEVNRLWGKGDYNGRKTIGVTWS
ncbi:protein FAR1-RELATED SEQUENCE 6-like [Silene latifolia]|uniref:protein FAR1-RELATED SEQUENCE 6-like n=1 Tax=Silene latifolia TaxID=37657 RepID=UPI003D780E28